MSFVIILKRKRLREKSIYTIFTANPGRLIAPAYTPNRMSFSMILNDNLYHDIILESIL